MASLHILIKTVLPMQLKRRR